MNVNIESLGITKEDLVDRIVESVSASVFRAYDDEISVRVSKEVNKAISAKVESMVVAAIQDEIDRCLQVEFQPIDVFGASKGQPTTVHGILEQSIQNWWSTSVNSSGKATDRWSSESTTRAEWYVTTFIRDTIKNALEKDLGGIVSKTKEQVAVAVGKTIAEIVKSNLCGK